MVTLAPARPVRRARIASLATYVPPRLLTNADLEKMVDTNDEWILQRTGIRERHIVEPGVATSDLAKEASLLAIERAGLTPADIDLIVVGTTTPDMAFPSTACRLQAKIGAVNAWGWDLSAACSGFTYALTAAAQMVAAGGSERALVVGADVMSSIIDYTDRATCVIFGDGAGAVLIEPTEEGEQNGLLDFNYEIDGSGGEFLRMPETRENLADKFSLELRSSTPEFMAERIRSLDKSPWFSGESFIGIRSVAWGDVEYPVAYIIESMAYFRDYGSAYTYALQTGGGLFDARYQNIMRCAHVEVM